MRAARVRRGERATPVEEGDPQESLSAGSYAQVLELEQLLLTTIQSKGPFDQNVRVLRSNIRELFEIIILEDHEFAEFHDVEQSLWRLHHTCIEEYRARIRKSMPPAGSAPPGNKSTVRKEPVQKIYAVFRSYLAEATGFYHDLMLKIGAKHGLSQDELIYKSVVDKNMKNDDRRIAEIRRCQLSCHRCLIFLGDLARYKEYYGDGDAKNRDWSIAAGFYVKSVSMWPASGNPYNQLAVLATYIGDEMLAVYHYFRSLASEAPFLTAKDNLVLLFEKNRNSYLRLVESYAGNSSQTAKRAKGKIKGETRVSQGMGDESSGLKPSDSQVSEQRAVGTDFMKHFRVRFVRLNGILFTRTSLEAFSEVHSSVLSDLEELLMAKETEDVVKPSPCSLTSGRNWGTGPNVLLQLISILIFSVHNVSVVSGPESHQPTYAEILQRSAVLTHAFIALFECIGSILRHCVKLDDPSNSMFLPAIVVVLEWLSCRPEVAVGNEVKEKERAARMFFWKNCVNFLNKFTTDLRCTAADDCNDRVVLWEDFELWGFTPLLPAQHKLNYGKKMDMGLGSSRHRQSRVQRLKHAGKIISDMFDGSDKGMHYDVETDVFYLMGEKKVQERKQVEVIANAGTLEEPPRRYVRDSEDFKLVAEPEPTLTKSTTQFEEEDEEVIVFKPSRKLKVLSKSDSGSESLIQENANAASNSINTTQPNASMGSRITSMTESELQFMVAPSMVSAATRPSMLLSSSTLKLQSEPVVGLVEQVSGSLSDLSAFQAAKNGGLDSITKHNAPLHGPFFGLLDKDLRAPGSQFEAGQLSGSTVDWGGGSAFSIKPSQNLIQSSVNWQPQDSKGNSSLWSSELHKLAPATASFGAQTDSNLAVTKRYPFMDPSLGSRESMAALTNAAQKLSESRSMPTQSMESLVSDARVQMKPRLQDPPNIFEDGNLGRLQATQDLNFLAARLKLNPGTPSDIERPARRVPTLPSNMRPPPGFGPLPAKPPVPVSLTAASALQSSQPASCVFSTANASLSQNMVVDQSGPLSVEENVDDYSWLDGYTPPKKDTSQSSVLGFSRVMGNTNYGWSTGRFSPALDATEPPFPGMKTLDHILSPPSFPVPPQQPLPPLSQVLLQQELLHKQQTQEQYQQQFFQEQRLQQLYGAQLAAQRNQIQQGEQQLPPPPSIQQPPVAVQPQMPQPFWPQPPGQNSFVS